MEITQIIKRDYETSPFVLNKISNAIEKAMSSLSPRQREIIYLKFYNLANKKLAISRAIWGTGLSSIGVIAYYGAYIFIIIETVAGILTLGDLTFLAGSFKRMRDMMQMIMRRFSSIADSAMYLQDLFDFLELEPNIKSLPEAKKIPAIIQKGFTFENVSDDEINIYGLIHQGEKAEEVKFNYKKQ